MAAKGVEEDEEEETEEVVEGNEGMERRAAAVRSEGLELSVSPNVVRNAGPPHATLPSPASGRRRNVGLVGSVVRLAERPQGRGCYLAGAHTGRAAFPKLCPANENVSVMMMSIMMMIIVKLRCCYCCCWC